MPLRFSRFASGSLLLVSVAAPLSCSDSGDDFPATAGTGGSGATAGSTSGGAPAAGKGGSSGSGSPAGTGGSSGTGATGPVAGSSSVGGAGATGPTGAGGAAGAGATGPTGAGGSSAGLGGAGTGPGGNAGTAGSSAGSSGAAGSGGSPACAGVASIKSSTCTAGESACFSFFVASRARMFAAAAAFNGSTKGWGGDFRYGTADGLTGADKLCTEIAEQSLPNNCRTWRAFLSTSTANAVDRVGSGPWYDRLNRTIANNVTELVDVRPGGITVSTILNNLPNEDGTPHHNEEVGCDDLNDCADNHDVLTGSDTDGKLCTSDTCSGFGSGFGGGPGFPGGPGGMENVTDYTCQNWTLSTPTAGIAPRCGHTWPTGGSGRQDDWISQLTENGCAPGFNLVQNGGPMPNGNGSVGEGGGYGAIYCLALSE